MANKKLYQLTGRARPPRSAFDLSYNKLFDCNFGELIPCMADEVVPGDVFSVGNEIVIRFQPMVAPVLHEINAYVHYFFVPYRLLDDNWEDFITGGEDGTDTSTLPRWDNHSDTAEYSLWDYFGFPAGVTVPASHSMAPIDYPKRAYNLIWNEFFRDQLHQTELTIATAKDVQKRNWEKDYFTAALDDEQKGTAPSLPLTGNVPVTGIGAGNQTYTTGPQAVYETDDTGTVNYAKYKSVASDTANHNVFVEEDTGNTGFPNIRADVSSANAVDVADLRLTFAIQKWMERNARGGSRYREFIQTHFNTDLPDYRAAVPVYLGGTKQSVIVSEVLQTSESGTTEQGNMAGHGLSADSQFAFKYRFPEFGCVIGMFSVMPRTMYCEGIDRQWLRETRYDFYNPLFANLSEQPIYSVELFFDTATPDNNDDIFGYIGRYDEMRTKKDMVCGDMEDAQDYWHLSRQFGSKPTLNSSFLECAGQNGGADDLTRIFAVPATRGIIAHVGNRITAVRPLPVINEPGLIDHG